MPTKRIFGRTFDARPDRVDFRDLPYRPRLVGLPSEYPSQALIEEFLPAYCSADLILNQGNEGACTGFGLAAVVNYLRWERNLNLPITAKVEKLEPISPRMLYQNARLYDEWKGEDYDGSSCRGAMKGFHKHGVCQAPLWPYLENGKPGTAKPGWDEDAPKTPLGAYFRIDGRSLVNMQSAILETHAIYVSADVHDGWDNIENCADFASAVIAPPSKKSEIGGHAFAIVGYNSDGFIVQNSWGPTWGYKGFARLPYEEWTQHGTDAWAIALGAPMRVTAGLTAKAGNPASQRRFITPNSRSDVSLDERLRARSVMLARVDKDSSKVSPWIDGEEFGHSIFIGHNGRAEREIVAANDGDHSVKIVIEEGLKLAAKLGMKHVAIYAHGGLNSRDAGVKRAQILGPWFKANGIHPIFVVWQTGFFESTTDILKGAAERLLFPSEAARGWLADKINAMKDRAFEVFARDAGVRAIWENMKLRAAGSADRQGGLTVAAQCLRDALPKDNTRPKLHLLGHSAGAIMQGHFLSAMQKAGLEAASMHLWAPACSVEFATDKFGQAFSKNVVDPAATYISVLSDANEKDDPCVPVLYSKSLLYLVSRALEAEHKTPILGLEKAWRPPAENDDDFIDDFASHLSAWQGVSDKVQFDAPVIAREVPTLKEPKKVETIDASHGSFDNNLDAVNQMISRVLGTAPKVPVTDLRGF